MSNDIIKQRWNTRYFRISVVVFALAAIIIVSSFANVVTVIAFIEEEVVSNSLKTTDLEIVNKFVENDDHSDGIPISKSYTKNDIPLRPPFHIIQYGIPRSGSTFQTQLLMAIIDLKSPPTLKPRLLSKYIVDKHKSRDNGFVVKMHQEELLKPAMDFFDIAIFTSGLEDEHPPGEYEAVYHQKKGNLYICSLCEIENYYKPIFGLTDDDVKYLKQYMSYFEIIRQCCGLQMSKYNMLRLHGCNTTQYQNEPGYPWCERHNLTKIEKEFHNLPIHHHLPNANRNYIWRKPGDCARYDKMVIDGAGFNGVKTIGCDI